MHQPYAEMSHKMLDHSSIFSRLTSAFIKGGLTARVTNDHMGNLISCFPTFMKSQCIVSTTTTDPLSTVVCISAQRTAKSVDVIDASSSSLSFADESITKYTGTFI